jgi:hypothetical protein
VPSNKVPRSVAARKEGVSRHPGIVLIEDGGLLRAEQLQVIRKAAAVLEGERDLINRILRIWLDGKTGGTERYFSRGFRYGDVLERPPRYA